jgi:hypothetical protein
LSRGQPPNRISGSDWALEKKIKKNSQNEVNPTTENYVDSAILSSVGFVSELQTGAGIQNVFFSKGTREDVENKARL